jgi:8-oxo-dGTP pyrophosphatase MutT (NUDIX family)
VAAVVARARSRSQSGDPAAPDPQDAPLFPTARPSAVLLARHDGPRGTEVVLTRRSRDLRRHRGEISFPGGRLDDGESPEEGALREAHEEVALDPAAVELIGRLSVLATVVSLSHIVPVVGRLQGRPELRPAAAEVERILHVPLAELVEPGVFREERWGDGPLERPIYFFELIDETIWGATARILVELLSVVLGEAP